MRNKDILLNDFDRVKTLCQYLYMDENHYIDVDNVFTTLRIRMTDDFRFKCKNLSFPDVTEMNYTEEIQKPENRILALSIVWTSRWKV